MTTSDPRMCRREAADLLNLDVTADPAAARQSFAKLLPRSGWIAPPSHRRALAEMLHPNDVTDSNQLALQIEQFASDFWSLAPIDRRARWSTLVSSCPANSTLRARLQRLEPGLDLPAATKESLDPLVLEWAGLIQALFVTHPTEQPERQWSIITSHRHFKSKRQWEEMARSLRAALPQTAQLGRAVIRGLLDERDIVPPRKPRGAKWPTEEAFMSTMSMVSGDTWTYHGPMQNVTAPVAAAPKRARSWHVLLMLFYVLCFIVGIMRGTNREKKATPPKAIDYRNFPFVLPKDDSYWKLEEKYRNQSNPPRNIWEKRTFFPDDPPRQVGPPPGDRP